MEKCDIGEFSAFTATKLDFLENKVLFNSKISLINSKRNKVGRKFQIKI